MLKSSAWLAGTMLVLGLLIGYLALAASSSFDSLQRAQAALEQSNPTSGPLSEPQKPAGQAATANSSAERPNVLFFWQTTWVTGSSVAMEAAS